MTLILGPLYSGKRAFACRLLHCTEAELSKFAVWDVQDQAARAEDLGTYFRIPRDDRDLYYEIPTVAPAGESAPAPSYHSRMARQLTIKQIQEKLLQVPAVRAAVGGGWT